MSSVRRLVSWLVRGCSEKHREEIEGDLIELHSLKLETRGPLHAGLLILSEALGAVFGRPSADLVRRGRPAALVLTGAAVGIAYWLLAMNLGDPTAVGWIFVMVGTALELLFWYLLFVAGRDGANRVG